MKSLLRNLVIAAMALLPSVANAVPAYPGLIKVTQPNGEVLQLRIVGDEYGHYYMTPDGIPVVADGKTFCYATLNSNNNAVSSSVQAHNVDARTADELSLLQTIDSEQVKLAFSRVRLNTIGTRDIAQSGVGVSSTFPNTGTVKACVILVQYADYACETENVNDYFTRLLNEEGFSDNDCTGSARDYFITASNGKFKPQFDVYGPVTLANNRSYYAQSDKYAAQMLVEAAKQLDSQINFKDYDTDGDGYCDNVYVFYAGAGSNTTSEDAVWPHQWTLKSAGYTVKYDGVYVNRYACSNEVTSAGGTPAGIGTFVHEFSHVLGMPEAYSGSLDVTPGYWDVMDIGCYLNNDRTPPTYSSFERNALKWIEPKVLSSSPDEITLAPLESSNTCCLIPTSSNKEFYLLENRQATGWDRYIPGHGLLVWHIDFDYSSGGTNSDADHQNTDIVEANGTPARQNKTTQAGYTFPGTTGITEITKDTTPGLVTWAGTGLDVPITDITENSSQISFKVSGGFPIKDATPTILAATDVTSTSFVANWEAVDGANDYLLTVADGSVSEEKETANCGSGEAVAIPYGWYKSFSSSKYYATAGFYGNASPALKMEKNDISGTYLRTRTYSSDVSSISFWYRGYQTYDSDALLVEGYVDSEWVTIESVSLPLTGETKTITEIPDGVKQVRFTAKLQGSAGAIALDDIVIIAGGADPIEGYNQLAVGNVTSATVKGLTPGATYKYSVIATDGTHNSNVSNSIKVTLLEGSSTVDPDPEPGTSTDVPNYGVPSGESYSANYLTALSASSSKGSVSRTWSSHPGSIYNLIDEALVVVPGDQITLDLTANCLSTSTSSVYEDLRYTCAYIYTDWSLSGTHTLDKQYGTRAPAANIKANYDEVMNISHTLTVPETATTGTSYVRVLYQNAWTDLSDGANSTNLSKGIAYDLPVTVTASTGVANIDVENGEAIFYNLQGMRVNKDRMVPGVYIMSVGGKTSKVLVR